MKKIRFFSAAIAAVLLSFLFFSKAQLIAADSSRSNVPQTVTSKLLNKADFGSSVPDNSQQSVDIVLKPRNQAALDNFVYNTVTPGSFAYRHYLSVGQFGRSFGDANTARAVLHYLSAFGIKGSISQDGLVIKTSGTNGQFEKAFDTQISHATYRGRHFWATRRTPSLPSVYASRILGILGLTTYNSLTNNLQKSPNKLNRAVTASDDPATAYPSSPATFADHYHLDQLYKAGYTGAGQSMAIVSLAEFNPADAYAYWQAMGIQAANNRINLVNVDGGSGWDGSDETSLDVEQSGALAPKARINVFVGPNTDTGFFDALESAVEQDQSAQLSISWGESETAITQGVAQGVETPVYGQIFNLMFEQAAAQGISSFIASGDQGAYDATKDTGTFDLSVDNPAYSPFVVAAGGTTLPYSAHFVDGSAVTVPQERAWGWDYLYQVFDNLGFNQTAAGLDYYFAGGGGGFSKFFATPRYQFGISGVNRYSSVAFWQPSSDFSSVQRLARPLASTGSGTGRNVPDVALNADPETGYGVYYSAGPGQPAAWDGAYGGTSFVAPQLNAVSALINSKRRTSIGFWNPQIYHFASSGHSPFTALTSSTDNNNLFYTGTPATIYNQGSGLGTINFAKLQQSFGTR